MKCGGPILSVLRWEDDREERHILILQKETWTADLEGWCAQMDGNSEGAVSVIHLSTSDRISHQPHSLTNCPSLPTSTSCSTGEHRIKDTATPTLLKPSSQDHCSALTRIFLYFHSFTIFLNSSSSSFTKSILIATHNSLVVTVNLGNLKRIKLVSFWLYLSYFFYSGFRLPGFKLWLHHFLAIWLQMNYLISLCLSFLIHKTGIVLSISVLRGLNELISVNHWGQCLGYCEYSLNVSYYYFCRCLQLSPK